MLNMKRFILFIALCGIAFSGSAQNFKGRSNTISVKIGLPNSFSTFEWINPAQSDQIVRTQEYTVEIGIRAETEFKQVDVYLNGRKNTDRGFKIVPTVDNRYSQIVSQEVYLNLGLNDITVSAIDTDGKVITDTRSIQYLSFEGDMTDRTDYAVLFGIDHYDSWDDLVNPINDTRTISQELQNNYGFRTETIIDPTSDEIWSKIREYAQKSYMDEDQLFIFFAGHGQFDEVFGEGYLVCKDSKLNDNSKASYISHVRLRNIINNIPCKHIFLVIDACFGGTFDPVIARTGMRGNENVGELPKTEFIRRKLQFKTRRYLTSGGKTYVPDGRPGQHSPFARKLLESLRSYGGSDQVVTLYEIINNVEKLNPEPRFGEFGENDPGSDFIFIAK